MTDRRFPEGSKIVVGSRKVAGGFRHNSVFIVGPDGNALREIHGSPASKNDKSGLTAMDMLGQPRLAVVSNPRNDETASRPDETGIRPDEDDRRTWRELKLKEGDDVTKVWSRMEEEARLTDEKRHKYFPFPQGTQTADRKKELDELSRKFETDPVDVGRVSGQDSTFNSNSALRRIIKGVDYDPDVHKPVELPGQSSPGSNLDIPKPVQSTAEITIPELSKTLYPNGEWSTKNEPEY